MADGWVELGSLVPGDLFEVNGQRFVRWYGGRVPGSIAANAIDDSSACRCDLSPGLLVRPLTPVAISPGLDPDLRGLLLAALAGGEVAPLADYLMERYADRDAAETIRLAERRRCVAILDGMDREEYERQEACCGVGFNDCPACTYHHARQAAVIDAAVRIRRGDGRDDPTPPAIRAARCPFVNHAPDCNCRE